MSCVDLAQTVVDTSFSGSTEESNQTLYAVDDDSTYLIIIQMPVATNASPTISWTDPEGNSRSNGGTDALSFFPARVKGGTSITYQVSGPDPIGDWTLTTVVVRL